MSYEYPAWCQMETVLDEYEQDRQAFPKSESDKLGLDAKRSLKAINAAAKALVQSAQELNGVDGLDRLGELAAQTPCNGVDPIRLLEEQVCITLAWESLGMLNGARERFVDVVGY